MTPPALEKLKAIEQRIAKKKGDFVLFALFLREDSPDRWDLVVSAPWIGDENKALQYLVAELKSHLKMAELIRLSRIIIVDPSDAPVQAINRAVRVEHGDVESRDRDFFGMHMAQALIITSKPLASSAA